MGWSSDRVAEMKGLCPKHGEPMLPGDFHGRRRCSFYMPEFGASEDYGCPQAPPLPLCFHPRDELCEACCGLGNDPAPGPEYRYIQGGPE